ncbi:hypothetical protein AVEN_62300-1 [Araneus ventricosus]|uniref:Uncharacterized protein n=1 Tax=Araneus ventricosus TaxID=182803 RepID=A0A4Y2ISA4_ARAVE|nr:hypothetical protein AVEN_62300-1 [Araneus ventricosus]
MEGSKNRFHEHQAIKFGGSLIGRTDQTAPPIGKSILGDQIDHKCGPVYCARSSPAFKTGPPCPNFPRITATHTPLPSFRGFFFDPRGSFPPNRLLYFSFMT